MPLRTHRLLEQVLTVVVVWLFFKPKPTGVGEICRELSRKVCSKTLHRGVDFYLHDFAILLLVVRSAESLPGQTPF
jgi:hypothetical protein